MPRASAVTKLRSSAQPGLACASTSACAWAASGGGVGMVVERFIRQAATARGNGKEPLIAVPGRSWHRYVAKSCARETAFMDTNQQVSASSVGNFCTMCCTMLRLPAVWIFAYSKGGGSWPVRRRRFRRLVASRGACPPGFRRLDAVAPGMGAAFVADLRHGQLLPGASQCRLLPSTPTPPNCGRACSIPSTAYAKCASGCSWP
ncbi:hypothetical protein D3C81_1233120 [compost metagenome]